MLVIFKTISKLCNCMLDNKTSLEKDDAFKVLCRIFFIFYICTNSVKFEKRKYVGTYHL